MRPLRPELSPIMQQVYVDAMHSFDSQKLRNYMENMYSFDVLKLRNYNDYFVYIQFAYAMLYLTVASFLLMTILVMEKRCKEAYPLCELAISHAEVDSDEIPESGAEPEPEPEPEPEAEAEAEVKPQTCANECCPIGQSFKTYYASFSDEDLEEKRLSLLSQCDEVGNEYRKAKEELAGLVKRVEHGKMRSTHLISSYERIEEICQLRAVRDKLKHHSLAEIHNMHDAIEKWKPFEYAPEGLYPFQKDIWQTAIVDEICARSKTA
jgi:hypothetical protein